MLFYNENLSPCKALGKNCKQGVTYPYSIPFQIEVSVLQRVGHVLNTKTILFACMIMMVFHIWMRCAKKNALVQQTPMKDLAAASTSHEDCALSFNEARKKHAVMHLSLSLCCAYAVIERRYYQKNMCGRDRGHHDTVTTHLHFWTVHISLVIPPPADNAQLLIAGEPHVRLTQRTLWDICITTSYLVLKGNQKPFTLTYHEEFAEAKQFLQTLPILPAHVKNWIWSPTGDVYNTHCACC